MYEKELLEMKEESINFTEATGSSPPNGLINEIVPVIGYIKSEKIIAESFRDLNWILQFANKALFPKSAVPNTPTCQYLLGQISYEDLIKIRPFVEIPIEIRKRLENKK